MGDGGELNQCVLSPGPHPDWPLALGQGLSLKTCLHYSRLTSVCWAFKVDDAREA